MEKRTEDDAQAEMLEPLDRDARAAPTEAAEKFLHYARRAQVLLHRISDAVAADTDPRRAYVPGKINWANVGDMARLAADLENISNYIGES